MAVANGYASLAEVKAAARITDTVDDALLEIAIESASRAIDGHTHRNFYVAGTVNAPIEVASGQTGININGNNIIATAANSVGIRCNGNCQIVGNWFELLSVGINGGGQSQLINSNWFNSVGTNWTNFGAASRFNGNFPN